MSAIARAVPKAVPIVLSLVAGYVDGVTFLALFGLFVAQVTGSFVVAGAQLVAHSDHWLVTVLAIPVFFLAGAGTTILVEIVQRRNGAPLAWALGAETLLLAAMFAAGLAGLPFRDGDQPLVMTATLLGLAAMGVQSAMVRLLMRGVASTNVMTTNTTQLSIDVAQTLIAWREKRRDPRKNEGYLAARARLHAIWPIVLGFLIGTGLGASAFMLLGFWCLVAPIIVVAVLTRWAMRGS